MALVRRNRWNSQLAHVVQWIFPLDRYFLLSNIADKFRGSCCLVMLYMVGLTYA